MILVGPFQIQIFYDSMSAGPSLTPKEKARVSAQC